MKKADNRETQDLCLAERHFEHDGESFPKIPYGKGRFGKPEKTDETLCRIEENTKRDEECDGKNNLFCHGCIILAWLFYRDKINADDEKTGFFISLLLPLRRQSVWEVFYMHLL